MNVQSNIHECFDPLNGGVEIPYSTPLEISALACCISIDFVCNFYGIRHAFSDFEVEALSVFRALENAKGRI